MSHYERSRNHKADWADYAAWAIIVGCALTGCALIVLGGKTILTYLT